MAQMGLLWWPKTKLKKQGRTLLRTTPTRQSSLQCRYDPLSYSLNFDPTGSGNLADDNDRFYAFSSRFVATSKGNICPRVLVAASH
ncbi:hypothetical protein Acr_00g0092240 [Actinidia rufa]|uniref:Uncharacterized protein n=1 Tax=Actinidia rufa TaxID=165716 RepID=A0A7J0DZ81_9ERIC|nr:hypothetical protein Acr_00g0092240 [Actinidia rufa]